ncbi:hypothetical protein MRY87_09305, partial [bacterium]|nr:hypothetical protein [bacterium]
EIKRLVRGGTFAPTLERIPVKRLGMYSYPMSIKPYYLEEEMVPSGLPAEPSSMSQQLMMKDVVKEQMMNQ